MAVLGQGVSAAGPGLFPTAALVDVKALGVTSGASTVYVATPRGLFRSANSSYSRWKQTNAAPDINAVSPNPATPDDIVYSTRAGIFRSTDGGRTASRTFSCAISALARAPNSPQILFAATGADQSTCPFILVNGNPVQAILRSANDGVTWTIAYRPTGNNLSGIEYGPLAIDPANQDHVVAGDIDSAYGSRGVAATAGVGHPWQGLMVTPVQYGVATAIGFEPLHHHALWITWGTECSGEIDRNGSAVLRVLVSAHSPDALAFDPLTGRAYITTSLRCGSQLEPAHLYSSDAVATNYVSLGSALPSTDERYPFLAITTSGYLLIAAAVPPGSAIGGAGPLVVHKINEPGLWPRASFLPANRVTGLGGVISPLTSCDGLPCQFFEKAAIATTGKHVAPWPVVTKLFLGAGAALPVGGTRSSVTYANLAALRTKLTAPPSGFHGGVAVSASGTFVPFSVRLGIAPGYVVPPYFWQFLTAGQAMPGGWLQAIGLPLTPAVQATVTKGSVGRRVVTIQAFQYAILTYDPRNPAAFKVERANIGTDYATAFPQATR